MAFNIRLKQSDAALRMLSPAGISASTKDQSEMYKIIVLDRHCKDIIAPLLRVNELRKHGVTLHLMLENPRQPISDVPAVYFVQPSSENIDRIVKDSADGLYESMYINFVSSVPRSLLEQLASGIVKADALQRVAKVFDQYLSFIALEPTLFSLGLPNTYVELNDPNARDTQIEASVTHIVEGLFSALVTLGVVPIIRCPKGGAAEHVATMLASKLRDNLKSNLFNESAPALSASMSRPLLCLFDRNYDLTAALQHTWSYKPLVQDILGLKLNRVTLAGAGSSPSTPVPAQKKVYDVDDKDFFWETCGSHPFPKVAEEVETQLQRYKAAVEEIGRSKDANGDVFDYEEMIRNTTQNLMSAVSSLPELQEKKKVLDKHTDIATGLLGHIKTRALDQYYNLEEDLLTGKADLQSVLRLIQGSAGSPADKTRLAILYLLAGETAPADAEVTELLNALRMAGGDTAAFGYVRTLRRNNLVGGTQGAASAMNLAGLAGSQANILDWADKTFGQGISSVTKSVKNLLSGARQMPVTSAVEALTDGKVGTAEFDGFAVFDPKQASGRVGVDRAKGPYRDTIVFVIGGGNYLERETLQAWGSRSTPPKQIIYGSTEMLTGEEFLHQLGILGANKGSA